MSLFRDMVSDVLSKKYEGRDAPENDESSFNNEFDNTAEDSSDYSADDDESTEYSYSSDEETLENDSEGKSESSNEEDVEEEEDEEDEEEDEEDEDEEEEELDKPKEKNEENKEEDNSTQLKRHEYDESLVESDEDSNKDDDGEKMPPHSSSNALAIEVIDRSTSNDDSLNSKLESLSSPDDYVTDQGSLDTPTVVQIFDDRPFYHLHKFQKELEGLDDFVESITFSLYIYVICNNTYHDPYMTCMMRYDSSGKYYSFPKIVYENSSTLDKETHMKSIKNKCFELLFPLFNIDPSTIDEKLFEHMDHAFQGYFYQSGNERGIIGINVEPFIPFLNQKSNATTLSQYFHSATEWIDEKPQYVWAGIDELLDQKKVYQVPVSPRITQMMKQYSWIHEIVDDDYRKSQIPKILFSEERNPQRSFDKNEGRLYIFHENAPSTDAFIQPRYVVFPSVESKMEGRKIYGVYMTAGFKEF